MKRLISVTAALVAAGGFGLFGCEKSTTTERRADADGATRETTTTHLAVDKDVKKDLQKAGEKVEDGARALGEKARESRDAVADKLRAGEATGTSRAAVGALPVSSAAPDAVALKALRSTLAAATEAALTTGGAPNLVDAFSKPDRDRVGPLSAVQWDDLDARIDQLNKDFRAKFGKDFRARDDGDLLFNDAFRFTAGDSTGSARPSGEKLAPAAAVPAPNNINNTNNSDKDVNAAGIKPLPDTTLTGADLHPAAGDTKPADTAPPLTGHAAADFASVSYPGEPPVTVRFVREGAVASANPWKIDVDDALTAQKLHDQLLKHLTLASEAKGQWPTDGNEARRLLSRHVFEALTNAGAARRDQ